MRGKPRTVHDLRPRPERPDAAFALPRWLPVALVAVTCLVYFPAWHGGLLWDDDRHITPAALQSTAGLWRIWFDVGATQQYYPVVHSAFWSFHRLWGDAALGYHLVSIGLHACSAWLLATILQRLAVPGAVLAAFVFALHPVHVESVAWIAELKNTLSGLCYFAAALVYLRFDRTRGSRDYGLALALFVVALLSKSVTATLPAALLVVLWWQRGRIDWRRDVLPLVPFLVIGMASSAMTAWVEHRFIGAEGVEFQISPVERVLIAGRASLFYLGKVIWPANLTFIYPRWTLDAAAWWQWLFPSAVIAILVSAWAQRGRSRAPLAALLFFVGTLVPALGFINVYPFRYSFVADHFQYLASAGLIALVCAAATRAFAGWRQPASIRIGAGAAVVALLGTLTWQQAHQYASAETLYRATIERNSSSWLAHNNLAVLKLHRSPVETEEAIVHFQEALRLNPDCYEAQYNLGQAFDELGRQEDAVTAFRAALAINPRVPHPHRNLAVALRKLGRLDEAISEYRAAIAAEPGASDLFNDLAAALMQLRRFEEASAAARSALALNPAYADAHFNLALILLEQGHNADAVSHLQTALQIRPDDAGAREWLMRALKGGAP